jgi:hypothetical protein
MILHVYKIKFEKTLSELEDSYECLPNIDKEKLYDLDAEGYFDYEDHNSSYIAFIITNPSFMKRYLSVLDDNLIKNKYLDISNDILYSKYDLESELKEIIEEGNLMFEFFIDDLNKWILDNLNIDNILDRISEVGIDNLKDIEKKFLENYKPQ